MASTNGLVQLYWKVWEHGVMKSARRMETARKSVIGGSDRFRVGGIIISICPSVPSSGPSFPTQIN